MSETAHTDTDNDQETDDEYTPKDLDEIEDELEAIENELNDLLGAEDDDKDNDEDESNGGQHL